MKKFIIKTSTLIAILFLFNSNTSSAQTKPVSDTVVIKATSDFVGVWELKIPKQRAATGQEYSLFHRLKIFNKDGSFSNLNIFPESSIVSHAGTYKTNGNAYYESIAEANASNTIEASQKLSFKFSDNKQSFFLSGVITGKNGNNSYINEEWQKITAK